MNYLRLLLIGVPAAILLRYLNSAPELVFIVTCLGIIPLASVLGEATEELAARTSSRLGGLLNATLGNAAELIIATFAIRAGLLDLVLASITGSILGNVLLIMGLSLLLGGLKNGVQRFDRTQAGVNATMLILAVIGLGVPSLFNHSIELNSHISVEYLSLSVSVVLIFIYGLWIAYSFTTSAPQKTHKSEEPKWPLSRAIIVLIVSTVFIAWLSEILVGSVEPVVKSWGVTEFFLGIIIIPLVGNAAEHLVGVQTALKNKMELSLAVSVGSSLQVALFVAPLLVFLSLLLGNPLTLIFNQFELIALAAAVMSAAFVSLDGESNWLEGAQLLAVYIILALAFFFL
jgi:Ca2+:H+ antiporter